ncbi:MAG TPA: SUMF1/EgtB/PvdO family nonheme iron enzyme [Pirellula sp.]|nr:SUMF1/EgtB/PvdO family nonheme iron enzyme [Pirellula sp.]
MKSKLSNWLSSAASVCVSSLLPVLSHAQESTAKPISGISKTKPETGLFVAIDGGKGGYMVPYTESFERTNISFEMIPIRGGEVTMGSPESESGRSEDEGPQFTVKLAPFWMAKTELTWGEYNTFMTSYDVFKKLSGAGIRQVTVDNRVDAITVPTPLYDPAKTYEYGDDKSQPAVTMTQYSAKQYTKWLSGLTGVQYRLPTEAEWEYAARAGSRTAYSFGNDPAELEKYAVFDVTDGAAKVGSKAPNAFGLHDMHGNVWEWTIDQFSPKGFEHRGGKSFLGLESTNWPTEADSRCARGGGWQDPAERLRSAARMGSADEDWKNEDPNVPLSPWWYTSDPARMVGMRLVRSAIPLSKEMIAKFWEIDVAAIQEDVDARLQEGRGAIGISVPELIKEFQRKK